MGSSPDRVKPGIRCFSAKHAALTRKSKDWLALDQDNVSEWGDMSIRGLYVLQDEYNVDNEVVIVW